MSAQALQALQIANRVRLGAAEARREISSGALSLEDALDDPRLQGDKLYRILSSQPRWGTWRTEKACRALGASPGRRVDSLTDRQKQKLVRVAEEM